MPEQQLTLEDKGAAMAALHQLVTALAFPGDGAISLRVATRTLLAVSRDLNDSGPRQVLVVVPPDGMPPDVYGPFYTVTQAQVVGELYRAERGLPREATAENNEVWTAAGFYFGIVELSR